MAPIREVAALSEHHVDLRDREPLNNDSNTTNNNTNTTSTNTTNNTKNTNNTNNNTNNTNNNNSSSNNNNNYKSNTNKPFARAVPLGANCLAAAWLQHRDLRKSAMPFDWAFSSPAMVSDCLADDFRAFLDPREYVAMGRRGAGTGHRRYSDLRLPGPWRGFVFLHHDPMRKRIDHEYFERSVKRFRHFARSPGRKLFVICCVVDSKESLEVLRGTQQTSQGPTSSALATESDSEGCRAALT
ncbi:unnamed protein product, partial [Polarella glacialis]